MSWFEGIENNTLVEIEFSDTTLICQFISVKDGIVSCKVEGRIKRFKEDKVEGLEVLDCEANDCDVHDKTSSDNNPIESDDSKILTDKNEVEDSVGNMMREYFQSVYSNDNKRSYELFEILQTQQKKRSQKYILNAFTQMKKMNLVSNDQIQSTEVFENYELLLEKAYHLQKQKQYFELFLLIFRNIGYLKNKELKQIYKEVIHIFDELKNQNHQVLDSEDQNKLKNNIIGYVKNLIASDKLDEANDYILSQEIQHSDLDFEALKQEVRDVQSQEKENKKNEILEKIKERISVEYTSDILKLFDYFDEKELNSIVSMSIKKITNVKTRLYIDKLKDILSLETINIALIIGKMLIERIGKNVRGELNNFFQDKIFSMTELSSYQTEYLEYILANSKVINQQGLQIVKKTYKYNIKEFDTFKEINKKIFELQNQKNFEEIIGHL